jgi:hypothetical protein
MDIASIPGLQDMSSLDLTISLSMEDSHRALDTLLRNTCSYLFPGLFFYFIFFLVRNEHPSMHPLTFIPMGNAFQFFVFHVHTFTTGGDDHPSAHCNEP